MSIFEDRFVTLAHGNGGRYMRELIVEIFARHLSNPELDVTTDAAAIALDEGMVVMTTTDGFIVQPLEFPGGDIGSLCVHGTVNDLAVSGAKPLYLTLNAFIEEGFDLRVLDRLVQSLGKAAKEAGVRVVAGDTKVVPRGHGGGLYLASTGIGVRRPDLNLGLKQIEPGDAILVSGPIGDHGIAVLLAREDFDLKGDVRSDNACVTNLTEPLLKLPNLRFMRDPTRGGLAMVCNEIAQGAKVQIRLNESVIPVREPVRGVCEMLGYDPYYLACEGRVVAIVSADIAEQALAIWKGIPGGEDAKIIGSVEKGKSRVIVQTMIGGERLLEELEDDPLPRIC
ncbi:MAG: hydrogenase expression/formation protein HypE [Robiginitomaculum sp.]|nr:MAG: hydrogenase expression/formation protein HypE [Robiginitomaculum sp.]